MPLLFANGTWWLCCEWVCVCCLVHGSVLEGEEPPVYCDGLVVAGVNSSMGFNFSDGSPVSSAYANDSECYFLLQGDQGTRVSMDLQRFSLEEEFDTLSVSVWLALWRDVRAAVHADVLVACMVVYRSLSQVYDGDSIFDDVLYRFSGDRYLPDVISSNSSMLVRFLSDHTIASTGFTSTASGEWSCCVAWHGVVYA